VWAAQQQIGIFEERARATHTPTGVHVHLLLGACLLGQSEGVWSAQQLVLKHGGQKGVKKKGQLATLWCLLTACLLHRYCDAAKETLEWGTAESKGIELNC